MFSVDDLTFGSIFKEPVKETDTIEKIVLEVYPLINGKRLNDDSVCVNLYELAVVYQRIKYGLTPSEILPFVCTCGDNGCIGVFSHLRQNVNMFRVEWIKPKEAEEDPNNPEYEFLEKRKYSFNKKQLMKNINDLFSGIQKLKDESVNQIFVTESIYSLDNALLIWQGKEPIFKSKEDGLREAIKNGEDIDYTEVLSLKDIIQKTATKNKTSPNEDEVK